MGGWAPSHHQLRADALPDNPWSQRLAVRCDQTSGQGAGGFHADLLADDCAHRQLETVPCTRHSQPGEILKGFGKVRVAAELREDPVRLKPWSDALVSYVDGYFTHLEVPLDVRGSRFEQRVWKALRSIPRGDTRAYSEVADSLGLPRGARAVARACARNPVAVAIPCHRVVEKSGELGGYRWGPSRKRALLQREAKAGRESAPSIAR